MAGDGVDEIRDMAPFIAPKNEAAALATLRRHGARLVERGAPSRCAPLAGVALVSAALALLGFASDESPVSVAQGVIEVKDLEEEALAALGPFVATGSFIDAEAVISGGAFTGAWDVASWRREFRDGKVYRQWGWRHSNGGWDRDRAAHIGHWSRRTGIA